MQTLTPLHALSHMYSAEFMRLTTTNISNGSPTLWVHFFFVLIYIVWALWLLKWHNHMVGRRGEAESWCFLMGT